ncbi:hypothetical protein BATDEDRAFT_85564 [Batrachochytrium dendrobatidis JAM81]|uniref:Uncharacterized protein n=1 Tax=Batrachochytrium dendrobatidis (strain JAM81 / FGSC 10211) TaxID=684364 RepID=F4NSX0_BATDJ|nr:uncharacterized protein BATDEDRAFT_85564 [Batrachochytrium dendrobatidis JAM81]EGF83866.1 hypothetical protein BATDEDRAFT_85564 [Batrachochytrium dendrobatidis JAM81]|eukprot:XP_006676252.1 hypothetical protein BATDEDRAFT_85564 [Batrachochytrium dendrobatidis JAM81]
MHIEGDMKRAKPNVAGQPDSIHQQHSMPGKHSPHVQQGQRSPLTQHAMDPSHQMHPGSSHGILAAAPTLGPYSHRYASSSRQQHPYQHQSYQPPQPSHSPVQYPSSLAHPHHPPSKRKFNQFTQEPVADQQSLIRCPGLQQILATKNEVSDRVKNNKELAYVIESSPQIVQFFQLIQMDRIVDRLEAIEQKLSRIDNLERSLEKAMSTTSTNLQISNPCLIELKTIAAKRMNGVRGAPYHCENENKEILKFLRQHPNSYMSLHNFVKESHTHEEKIGSRFSELITNAKSGRKKLLVPKSSSHLFLPSMSSLDEWTRVMFDSRTEEPTLDQVARAAFLASALLRFFRDHGHLLQVKINGSSPTLSCTCQNAYEHLPALREYHMKKSSQAHSRLVTSFAKKNWLLSGFWRDFDRAIDEVYQHADCDRIVQQVIEIDRANYTTSTKPQGSMDGVHLVPPRDRPLRRSTDTSVVSLAPSTVSYEGIGSCGSPQPAEEDWFSLERGEEDT